MNKIITIIAAFALVTGATSCKKYLDIEPVGRVIPKTEDDFRALMTSAYVSFPTHKSLLSLRTDEQVPDEYSSEYPNYRDIYTWKDANPDPVTMEFAYEGFYKTIFYANQVIAEVENEAGKSTATAQLKGEAYLMRAYAHFELLNLYAKPYNAATASTDRGVPLAIKIDLEQNYAPATVEAVYTQILADIAAGRQLLNTDNFESGKNYRFTTRAALALLARVREFRGEWTLAQEAATAALAINNALEDLNTSTRLPSHYQSAENIMSMEKAYDLRNVAYISNHLLTIYDQQNDLRYPLYFRRSGGDYVSLKGNNDALKISFHNGELYLIQAEAALQTDNLTAAREHLLALKVKRLKPAYYQTEATRVNSLNKQALLEEIIAERERELALEGHRWYDLRRYGQPTIKHEVNGETFTLEQNDPRYTLRFPKSAIANNPNLL
jgi:starch-binding outer membrane protein, SusD/RagB family